MQGQSKMKRWGPFALLIVVGASRWAVASVRADAEPTIASLAAGSAWAALVALALSAFKTKGSGVPKVGVSTRLRWSLSGAMLFGGPAIALFVPARDVDAGGLTIALALTPIVIAVASGALGSGRSEGIAGRIWPALAAVAGLLLVLVQPDLGDARTDLVLLLAPLLAGTGAALFAHEPEAGGVSRAPMALLGACSLFALALVETRIFRGAHASFSLLAIAWDGVMALLSVVVLGRLGATRWSSQFTWIPLLIILEGMVMVRPPFSIHWFVGPVLLAVAGVYLLLPQSDDSSEAAVVPNLPV